MKDHFPQGDTFIFVSYSRHGVHALVIEAIQAVIVGDVQATSITCCTCKRSLWHPAWGMLMQLCCHLTWSLQLMTTG